MATLSSSNQRSAIHEDVEIFFNNGEDMELLDIEVLSKYLKTKPDREKPIAYISQFADNEALAHEILAGYTAAYGLEPDFKAPSAAFFSLLVSQPREKLELIARQLRRGEPAVIQELTAAAGAITPLSQTCHNTATHETASEPRSDRAKKQALHRDGGVCVLLGIRNPEGAHFWPHSASREDVCDKTRRQLEELEMFLPTDDFFELTNLIAEKDMIDHVSNMICLSPTMHDWMGRGYFVLDPVSEIQQRPAPAAKAAQKPAPSPNNRQTRSMINPVEDLEYFIRLRFEWLMQPKNTDQNTAIDNKKIKDLLDANPNEGPLMAFSVHKGRALVTGDVFEMVSDNKNDLPRYEVLKLLVLLGRIRSIAGAAGPRADSPSSSTNTSEDGIANVEIGMRDINIQSDKGKTLENVPGEEAENGANNGERQRFWKRWVPNRKRSPSNSRVSQHTPAASPKQGTLRRRMSEISLKSRELLERFGRGNDDGQQASRNEAIREMASGAVETIPTIGEISLVDTSLEWPSQYRGSTPDPGWPTPGIPV